VRLDGKLECIFAGQAEFVLPLESDLLGTLDGKFGNRNGGAVRLSRLPIDLGGVERSASGGYERSATALDQGN